MLQFFEKLFGAPVEQLEPAQAQARLKAKDSPFLLDVRQPEEYRAQHIPGARLIPLGELPRRIKELPSEREIVVVCQTGSRSSSAVRQLVNAGYRSVNLRGGMLAWNRQGLPTKRG